MSRDKWVGLAIVEDPDGALCGFCGLTNYFADDYGWFYMSQEDKKDPTLPCCKSCYNGEIGSRHISRYGIGER